MQRIDIGSLWVNISDHASPFTYEWKDLVWRVVEEVDVGPQLLPYYILKAVNTKETITRRVEEWQLWWMWDKVAEEV
jgi:hypothetical protein